MTTARAAPRKRAAPKKRANPKQRAAAKKPCHGPLCNGKRTTDFAARKSRNGKYEGKFLAICKRCSTVKRREYRKIQHDKENEDVRHAGQQQRDTLGQQGVGQDPAGLPQMRLLCCHAPCPNKQAANTLLLCRRCTCRPNSSTQCCSSSTRQLTCCSRASPCPCSAYTPWGLDHPCCSSGH